ncbi:MAG: hypothetical protein ACLGIN_09895 [Candidatus Sericytochromatia bacterium]
MRHSLHSIFIDQAGEKEAIERYDEALELLYQVHRWAPEAPELWLRMGALSFLLTDRGWLRRHGLEATALGDMGAVNARLYLARAVELAPGSAQARFWLGWVRHALYQDAAGAKEALAAALAIEAEHPYAHAAIARIEQAEAAPGYHERAVAHLTRAIARLPESARFHYDLGACLAGLGDETGARRSFSRAMATGALRVGPLGMDRYLEGEFHADGETVGALVTRLYPGLKGG